MVQPNLPDKSPRHTKKLLLDIITILVAYRALIHLQVGLCISHNADFGYDGST